MRAAIAVLLLTACGAPGVEPPPDAAFGGATRYFGAAIASNEDGGQVVFARSGPDASYPMQVVLDEDGRPRGPAEIIARPFPYLGLRVASGTSAAGDRHFVIAGSTGVGLNAALLGDDGLREQAVAVTTVANDDRAQMVSGGEGAALLGWVDEYEGFQPSLMVASMRDLGPLTTEYALYVSQEGVASGGITRVQVASDSTGSGLAVWQVVTVSGVAAVQFGVLNGLMAEPRSVRVSDDTWCDFGEQALVRVGDRYRLLLRLLPCASGTPPAIAQHELRADSAEVTLVPSPITWIPTQLVTARDGRILAVGRDGAWALDATFSTVLGQVWTAEPGDGGMEFAPTRTGWVGVVPWSSDDQARTGIDLVIIDDDGAERLPLVATD